MEKRLSMFLASLFLCVGAALAQVQVKGTIISADDGEPLPGASVKVVGSKTGTVTDINGDFVISVPDNDTRLEISHIGMLPRVIRARNGMRISLDTDNKILDELIVTAYGTQTKAQFTGSASVMNAEELDKYQVTNAIDALKGRASGVQINNASGQPGMSSTIRIRGINSLNAASDPLIAFSTGVLTKRVIFPAGFALITSSFISFSFCVSGSRSIRAPLHGIHYRRRI